VALSRYLPPVAKREPQAEESPGLARLPPGRHGLPRDFVVQNQRDRLAAGIIAAVSEFGYHETTITQIAAAAGVSRRTFYSYFNSKEECYLDTFDQIAAHLCDAAREAADSRNEWPAKVAARLAAALDIFATNPQLAGFTLAVPPRAGNDVTSHYRRALDRALGELLEGVPAGLAAQAPSPAVQHSLIGGAVSLIVQKLEAGEGDRIRELLPDLVELFLTPFVGRTEAVLVAKETSQGS
jgi:AcrR family transcriptional regulator